MYRGRLLRLVLSIGACLLWAGVSWAAHISTHASPKTKSQKVNETQRTRRRLRRLSRSRATTPIHASLKTRRRRSYERFHMSSFSADLTGGDITAG